MEFSEKLVRKQLERMKPILASQSIEHMRIGQDRVGAILAKTKRKDVDISDVPHPRLLLALASPHDERRGGIILYLHGGGYACGGLEYAKGFASVLAAECGVKVTCLAYRLAPENPYPAALEDALNAYRHLLSKGYLPERITLCGESAGGGLCYALCYKLRELRLPLPSGIIAISPWTDLTMSGDSIIYNKENDPSLCLEQLESYAGCYTSDTAEPLDPFVSPLFGDMAGLPPSLIFAGGDEILLDDALRLHDRLIESGCASRLRVADRMWHGYVLYCLKEHHVDFEEMERFLQHTATVPRKLRWMRLDNAAKIFPAAKRRYWNNYFRLSATMFEDVDRAALKSAMDVTMRRFPSIAVRLCRGFFWYYLEEISSAPEISEEQPWPLAHTPFDAINKCALRVIVYGRRIAVEFYHALTDGTGGMIFLKTLLAEYIEQKYGATLPCECGVLDRHEEPRASEMEDSFEKYAGKVSLKRNASTVYKLKCTQEPIGVRHLTTFILDVDRVLVLSKSMGISLTVCLASCMLLALQNLQNEQIPDKKKQRPIRVVVPVNLRRLFPSETLRNFAHVVMPEIDPRMGDFEFDEIASAVKHQLGLLATEKNLQAMFTPNVNAERNPLLRVMPLFVKNMAMKLIYDTVGERTNCLNVSNLGAVELPEEMKPFVDRFDFILGVQATKPNNCGVLSYKGKLYVNFIRNTVEPSLERHFHAVLKAIGLPALVESNFASTENARRK
ncbi:MAG: alpha/beta hydrolase fold domain-containing protein [Clostridia bacterium]|nr:alpha/beta hydrolase fold domain-containing protein [Clostridia bacterium]